MMVTVAIMEVPHRVCLHAHKILVFTLFRYDIYTEHKGIWLFLFLFSGFIFSIWSQVMENNGNIEFMLCITKKKQILLFIIIFQHIFSLICKGLCNLGWWYTSHNMAANNQKLGSRYFTPFIFLASFKANQLFFQLRCCLSNYNW